MIIKLIVIWNNYEIINYCDMDLHLFLRLFSELILRNRYNFIICDISSFMSDLLLILANT